MRRRLEAGGGAGTARCWRTRAEGDRTTARAAGVVALGAVWGWHPPDSLRAAGAFRCRSRSPWSPRHPATPRGPWFLVVRSMRTSARGTNTLEGLRKKPTRRRGIPAIADLLDYTDTE